MKFTVCVFICVAFLSGSGALAEQVGFKVIVNASNPTISLSSKDVSKLFLKKITTWKEDGEKAEPVDLVEDSDIRRTFSEYIHGRKVSSIRSYWQKKIFSGRGVPPTEKESEAEVLEFVGENVGAIGYVAAETDISSYDVKVLDLQD